MGSDTLLRLATLNAAYAAALDSDRLEDWPGFFRDPCVYKITSADNRRRGYEAGIVYADCRAMLEDRVTALRQANVYERQSYRHVVGLPVLGTADANGFRAETPFLVARTMRDGRMDLFAAGIYLDSVHDEDGELRLAERIVVCDGRVPWRGVGALLLSGAEPLVRLRQRAS